MLHFIIPGQNLDRAIPSKTDMILQYDFMSAIIRDSSGNGYDGTCEGCIVANGTLTLSAPGSVLKMLLTSKGRNYMLSFSINPSSPARIAPPIFSGPDSMLVLGNGTVTAIALISGN
ncbi:Glycoside hydrolase [Mycena chlorophos]|uniref:Glycoside hydrolase n=1 Tax=Mycena chlorophos TaxID=658473 RepID=A0A8H6WIR8_MYCCL|nr:Glycoside hydrolase [Mycena chlorophos]